TGASQLVVLALLEGDEGPAVAGTARPRQVDAIDGACRARHRQHAHVRLELLEGGGVAPVAPVAPDIGARMRGGLPVVQVAQCEPTPEGGRRLLVGDVTVRAPARLRRGVGACEHRNPKDNEGETQTGTHRALTLTDLTMPPKRGVARRAARAEAGRRDARIASGRAGTEARRALAIHVAPVALEAERVIAIPLHDAVIAEEGPPGLALPADVPGGPGIGAKGQAQ